jgi:hypothetical protein
MKIGVKSEHWPPGGRDNDGSVHAHALATTIFGGGAPGTPSALESTAGQSVQTSGRKAGWCECPSDYNRRLIDGCCAEPWAECRACGRPPHVGTPGPGSLSRARIVGLYPIVTFQYSSTTLYQVSHRIQYLFF